ncbi:hypothetical protein [Bifidobacterium vespertilionis]|uniref:Uncharacterized protein n=1 Tax=Bifidobacterium vespertilionis TaxID=2562524 RepID=A0A5J5E5L4_9BIFI|nr:hypothetical protein [Bifidobacterium vespertilionis]KAA8822509.1 hypothetical protein EMO90_00485 [Bifidobacterium vespertilionis]KAA8824429.1 hypothetical protein EM848_01040 [Bifidobacterium vespertilionis]
MTMELIATPITEPASPIRADSRNDVTAARAPAVMGTHEMFRKKPFNQRPPPRPALPRPAYGT